MTVQIIQGDALTRLRELPSDHFHCVVTSPPYWGLRDYGTGTWEGGDPACDHGVHRWDGPKQTQGAQSGHASQHDRLSRQECRCGARRIDQQIGLEETPEQWCARLVAVFREVRRVLRPDGVLWLNCGDSYAGSWGNQGRKEERGTQRPINNDRMISQVHDGRYPDRGSNTGAIPPGTDLKPKDLIGQPWMLAFALRADGWWLRSEVIWAKPNPMPESVRDRPTKAHEQVFLLTRSPRYFYDAEAVRETSLWQRENNPEWQHQRAITNAQKGCGNRNAQSGGFAGWQPEHGRNLRSVWTIATDPLPSIIVDGEKLDHFASYPTELARRCILAGTSAKGCCPACGAPWARVVERTGELIGEDRGGDYRGREIGDFVAGQRTLANGERYRPGSRYETREAGWRPTCACDTGEPIPCRVLDPFGGSGRTALAADELGRDCTLIELNPASCRMAQAQIERARARRYIGDAPHIERSEGQLGLFDEAGGGATAATPPGAAP